MSGHRKRALCAAKRGEPGTASRRTRSRQLAPTHSSPSSPHAARYAGATKPNQDDIDIILKKLPQVADDHGNDPSSSRLLDSANNPSGATVAGVINTRADVDVFSVRGGPGALSVALTLTNSWGQWARSDLDAQITLLDERAAAIKVWDNPAGLLEGELEAFNLPEAVGAPKRRAAPHARRRRRARRRGSVSCRPRHARLFAGLRGGRAGARHTPGRPRPPDRTLARSPGTPHRRHPPTPPTPPPRAQGAYYLVLNGVGQGANPTVGRSDYGSLGSYRLTVRAPRAVATIARCAALGADQLPRWPGSDCGGVVLARGDLYSADGPVTVTPPLPAGMRFAPGERTACPGRGRLVTIGVRRPATWRPRRMHCAIVPHSSSIRPPPRPPPRRRRPLPHPAGPPPARRQLQVLGDPQVWRRLHSRVLCGVLLGLCRGAGVQEEHPQHQPRPRGLRRRPAGARRAVHGGLPPDRQPGAAR